MCVCAMAKVAAELWFTRGSATSSAAEELLVLPGGRLLCSLFYRQMEMMMVVGLMLGG